MLRDTDTPARPHETFRKKQNYAAQTTLILPLFDDKSPLTAKFFEKSEKKK